MSPLSVATKVLSTLAAGLVFAVGAALPATAAIPGMRFTIRPHPESSLSEGGDYFVLKAQPGKVVEQALELSNPTTKAVDVRLAPVDATTAQFGGVDYSPSGTRPQAAGAWLDLAKERTTLAPGETAVVAFEVAVPEDAPSGITLGGIAAWTPPAGERGPDAEGVAATVQVQTRRVIAVQVELPGPAAPRLEIGGVTAIARPDGVYLQVDITNTGNSFAEGEGTLELPGESFSSVFPLDKVVPGTSVGYPVKWRDAAPADGEYPVTVRIDYGADEAEFEGDITVGAGVRSDLADRGIGNAGGAGSLPVAPAAAVVVIVAAAGGAWVLGGRRRRRSKRPVPPPATRSAPPAVPAFGAAPPPPPARPAGPPPPPPVAQRG